MTRLHRSNSRRTVVSVISNINAPGGRPWRVRRAPTSPLKPPSSRFLGETLTETVRFGEAFRQVAHCARASSSTNAVRGPMRPTSSARGRKSRGGTMPRESRSEEHTSELQSPCNIVCRLLLEKKKKKHLILHEDSILTYMDKIVRHYHVVYRTILECG